MDLKTKDVARAAADMIDSIADDLPTGDCGPEEKDDGLAGRAIALAKELREYAGPVASVGPIQPDPG